VVEAEQDPERAHPLTYAKLGFANVSRLIADASGQGGGRARPSGRVSRSSPPRE
jgi:hypothetical protein